MSVSVRTRFEVFKRDGFKCSYCGRTAESGAQLEADHVLPVAAGGTDDLENLTTSCWECNHGKAAKLLAEGSGPAVSDEAIQRVSERVERQREYAELMAAEREGLEYARRAVIDRWGEVFGAERDGEYLTLPNGYWPDDRSLLAILRRLPLDQVLRKIDATVARFKRPTTNARRYFYGCCWHSIKEGPKAPATHGSTERDESLEDEVDRLQKENADLRGRLADPDKLRVASPEWIGVILAQMADRS